jgi:hypothetical protein
MGVVGRYDNSDFMDQIYALTDEVKQARPASRSSRRLGSLWGRAAGWRVLAPEVQTPWPLTGERFHHPEVAA